VKAVKDTELKTNGENTVCKKAFSKLKQHLILRYFQRIDARSVVNAQF